jgi:hypothetical protein
MCDKEKNNLIDQPLKIIDVGEDIPTEIGWLGENNNNTTLEINNKVVTKLSEIANKYIGKEETKDSESQEWSQEQKECIEEVACFIIYHQRRVQKSFPDSWADPLDKIVSVGMKLYIKNGIWNWSLETIEKYYGKHTYGKIEEIINNSQYYHYFELIG